MILQSNEQTDTSQNGIGRQRGRSYIFSSDFNCFIGRFSCGFSDSRFLSFSHTLWSNPILMSSLLGLFLCKSKHPTADHLHSARFHFEFIVNIQRFNGALRANFPEKTSVSEVVWHSKFHLWERRGASFFSFLMTEYLCLWIGCKWAMQSRSEVSKRQDTFTQSLR